MCTDPPIRVQSNHQKSFPGFRAASTNGGFISNSINEASSCSCSLNGNASASQSSFAGNVFLTSLKVLIVAKQTKYEYELEKSKIESTERFLQFLECRFGKEAARILKKHELQQCYTDVLINKLKEWGTEVKLVTRQRCSDGLIDWCNVVISAGGDGTFLFVSSKIPNNQKPVIGVNTDPENSVGELCLKNFTPSALGDALESIAQGNYRYEYRQRIRVTLRYPSSSTSSELGNGPTTYKGNSNSDSRKKCRWSLCESLWARGSSSSRSSNSEQNNNNPGDPVEFLALNEVFVGEFSATRVSKYELQLEDRPARKQKSSGFIASTGTGSTGWFRNTNRLDMHSLTELLTVAKQELKEFSVSLDENGLANILQNFNAGKPFPSTEPKMAYVVREPINMSLSDSSRGFCQRATITSLCYDGCVVADGGATYPFNEGATVTLELRPEDALRTIALL